MGHGSCHDHLQDQLRQYAAARIQAVQRSRSSRRLLVLESFAAVAPLKLEGSTDCEDTRLNSPVTSPEEERKVRQGFLRSVPLLGGLSDTDLARLADMLAHERYGHGEEIITQSDEGDSMFFLRRGAARADVDGKVVMEYRPGGAFGELALMQSAPRAATVTAVGDAECLRLGRKPFEQLLGSAKKVADHLQDQLRAYREGERGDAWHQKRLADMTVHDVAAGLESVGLGKYAASVELHGVDGGLCSQIDNEGLLDIIDLFDERVTEADRLCLCVFFANRGAARIKVDEAARRVAELQLRREFLTRVPLLRSIGEDEREQVASRGR